jgi:hypothetical protein
MDSCQYVDLMNPNIGEQYNEFIVATYLLTVEPSTDWSVKHGGASSRVMTEDWLRLTNINPGNPLGSYQRNGDIFTREFEKVKVEVDYSTRTGKITEKEVSSVMVKIVNSGTEPLVFKKVIEEVITVAPDTEVEIIVSDNEKLVFE